MAKNFVIDEFGKIALEKGWIKKAEVAPWENLPKSYQKEENVPPYLTEEQKQQWIAEQQKSQMPKTEQPTKPVGQSPQMMNVINSVQWLLKNTTKMPVSNPQGKYQGNPDGLWGARSAAAWNTYLEINPMLSQYVKKADPSGRKIPSVVELKFLIDEWAPYVEKMKSKSVKKEPSVQKGTEAPVAKKPRQAVPIGAYDIGDVGINQRQFDLINKALSSGANMSPGMMKAYRLLYPYGHKVENGKIVPIEPTAADDMVEANRNNNLSKEAEMPLTQQQEQVLKSIMTLKNLNFSDALEYAKERYPRVFSNKPLPEPVSKDPWDPKTWGIEQPDTMEKILPVGEDVLKGVEEKMQGQYPEFKMNNDGLFYAAKKVIDELVSLANDLDEMGEEKAAFAVDKQLKIYKSAVDKLYDITGETGDDLVNQAHPGGGPTLFKAEEEGGKVETIIEEHKKVLDKANKAPTGKYAEVISKLVATANMLEEKKEFEAAANIDKTIAELWKQFPFVDRSLASEAASSEDNKASLVKKADKFSSQKKIWDDIINNYYNPIKEEASGFLFQKYTDTKNYFIVEEMLKRLNNAEIQKNRVVDSWNFSNAGQISSLVNNFAKSLDLQDRTFIVMEKMFVGSEKEHKYANLYDEMVKKLYELANLFKQAPVQAPVSQTPTKQVSKQPKETLNFSERYRKTYLNNVIGTSDKIIELLNKDPAKSVKFLGSAKNVQQLINELTELKTNVKTIEEPEKLVNLSSKLWNRVYKNLQRKLAQDNNKLTKIGESILERLMSEEPAAKKKQAPVSRRPSVRRDPNVIRLQTALEAAGFSPGKIDGLWGPRTAMAYNSFINKMNLDKYLKQIANPRAQRDSDKSSVDIAKAVNLAEYVAKKQEGTVNQIQLPGFPSKISLGDLKDPQTFVNYMRYTLGSKNFTPDAALGYLQEISGYLDENEMEMVNKDPGSVSRWRTSIDSLAREFQKYRGQKSVPGQQGQQDQQGQQGQMGKEGPAPSGYRILNAQDFINKLNRLPDINGLLSPMMFQEAARLNPEGPLGPLEPKEYFNRLKEKIAYLYSYWQNNFRFMNDVGRRADEVKEKLLRYTGALSYINKHQDKFFGGGQGYVNPKDNLIR